MDPAASATGANPESSRGVRRVLGRYIAGGLIVFVAIAGGIYVGFGLAMRNATGNQATELPNRSYMNIGDELPAYKLYDTRYSQEVSLTDLVGEKPAVLVYVSQSCPACEAMSGYWKQRVLQQFPPEIRLLEIYDTDEWNGNTGSAGSKGLFPGAIQVHMKRDSYRNLDGIDATPTVVAINSQKKITLVCTGFQRSIGADLILKAARP